MKAIKITLAALMAVFAISTASAQSAEAGAKYNEAAAKYNAKDFAAALPLLQEAVNIALDADDVATAQNAQKLIPQANFQQGLALAKANKLEESIPYLEAAMETGELYNVAAASRNAKTMISQVYTMMGGQAFNNKDFAKAAGKRKDVVRKWMSGHCNFSLRTVAFIEGVLGESIFLVDGDI